MLIKVGVGLFAIAFVVLGAQAHEGAAGIVAERMDAMEEMGRQMKQVARQLRSSQPPDAAQVQSAGQILAGLAQSLPEHFPKGSNAPPSDALPDIWTDWSGFTAIAGNLQAASQRLTEAAAGNGAKSALSGAFAGMTEACAACHEQFRAP